MNLEILYVAGCFITAGLLHHNWDRHMARIAKHPISNLPHIDLVIKVAAFLTVFAWPFFIWFEIKVLMGWAK